MSQAGSSIKSISKVQLDSFSFQVHEGSLVIASSRLIDVQSFFRALIKI